MYKTPTFAEPQQCNRPFSTGLDIGKTYLNRKRAQEFTDYCKNKYEQHQKQSFLPLLLCFKFRNFLFLLVFK